MPCLTELMISESSGQIIDLMAVTFNAYIPMTVIQKFAWIEVKEQSIKNVCTY